MNHVDAVFCHMLVVSFWNFEEVGLTLDSLGPESSRMYLCYAEAILAQTQEQTGAVPVAIH